MINITDKSYKPNIIELSEYIVNPLFDELCRYMQDEFETNEDIEYSVDSRLPGWNLRFYKAGKTLCRLYPNHGFFSVLIVVGQNEKERVEAILPRMSAEMQKIYCGTQEGMGQRWLVFDQRHRDAQYEDLLKIIHIRRSPKSERTA